MGAYGYKSYENDHCSDALYGATSQQHISKAANKALNAWKKKKLTLGHRDCEVEETLIGVVIWSLERTQKVPKTVLREAKKVAEMLSVSLDYLDTWRSSKARKKALKNEIKIISQHLEKSTSS